MASVDVTGARGRHSLGLRFDWHRHPAPWMRLAISAVLTRLFLSSTKLETQEIVRVHAHPERGEAGACLVEYVTRHFTPSGLSRGHWSNSSRARMLRA